jgi:hypothetical protein
MRPQKRCWFILYPLEGIPWDDIMLQHGMARLTWSFWPF